MADQVLTLRELEDVIYEATNKMLDNKAEVRIAWQVDGSPDWSVDEDMVFLRVTPEDNRLARQQNILYNEKDKDNPFVEKRIGYTRVHKIEWTLYGPNSYDYADLIRYKILDDEYMRIFKKKNLFLITDVQMPIRAPEYYKGQWWDRTSFSASYNEAVIRVREAPIFDPASVEILIDR